MTQDITRWLTEIRTLQQQLAAARQERDQAYRSAANWRQLYDAEAKQRRQETEQMEVTIATLRAELDALRSQTDSPVLTMDETNTDINSIDGLRTELVKALQQSDRLQKALEAERADHASTRHALTTALGEAIDALSPNQSAIVRQPTGSDLQAPESPSPQAN